MGGIQHVSETGNLKMRNDHLHKMEMLIQCKRL